MSKISIVIPLYNEEEIVDELFSRLGKATKALEHSFEFIFVDDGSQDGTLKKIIALQENDPRITIAKLSRNWGHQNAFSAGLDCASGDAIILMDGDLEDPPELIPEFIRKWQEGFEVVNAVKRSRHDRHLRKILFSLFHRLLKMIANVPFEMQSGMFSLIDQKVSRELKQCKEKNKYFPGLRFFVGFKNTRLLYDREQRFSGKPKQTYKKLFNEGLNAFFSFSFLPIRLLTYFGFFILIVMFFCSIFFIVMRVFGPFAFIGRDVPYGWTTLVLTIFFILGIQIISLGVLGEYVARVFDEVRNRPFYIIDKIYQSKQTVRTYDK